MFRFMFRVAVVLSVVLGLTVFAIPTVQAGPSKITSSTAKADPGLLQKLIGWINLTSGQGQKGAKVTIPKSRSTGPCIDPMGRPIPCP